LNCFRGEWGLRVPLPFRGEQGLRVPLSKNKKNKKPLP